MSLFPRPYFLRIEVELICGSRVAESPIQVSGNFAKYDRPESAIVRRQCGQPVPKWMTWKGILGKV
jgi:hypothetical protein